MFIQDPINLGMNITAEIPDKKVIAFQKYCRQFHEAIKKKNIQISFHMDIDLYALQSSSVRMANETFNTIAKKTDKRPSNESGTNSVSNTFSPPISKDIFKSIEAEAANLLARSDDRIQAEKQIIEQITKYIKMYKSNLNVHQYGSTTYGFGNTVDLNILVETGNLLLLF